jgi:hypothetical protein
MGETIPTEGHGIRLHQPEKLSARQTMTQMKDTCLEFSPGPLKVISS